MVLSLEALPSLSYLQLDWLRIAEWVYAGIFVVTTRIQTQERF